MIEGLVNAPEKRSYSVSIGIPVYNEENNIEKLIESILSQSENSSLEIIFILSGCTDRSEQLLRGYMKKDDRISLYVQERREGKSSAINLFLRMAKGDVMVITSSDVILEKECLRKLLLPLLDPKIAMVGVRPLPVRNSNGLVYSLNKLLWQLHHELCLRSPKLGETVAFRKVFDSIPGDCVVDELYIEAMIKSKGYELCYKEDAVVYNFCPVTLKDLFLQRTRIFWGHIDIKRKYGYKAASMRFDLLVKVTGAHILMKPYSILLLFFLAGLESAARLITGYKYFFQKNRISCVWPHYKK